MGSAEESQAPILEPVLNYHLRLPEGCDVHRMLLHLRQLEEEEPMLRVMWDEELGEIYVQLMGAVQIEVLQSLIRERFHTAPLCGGASAAGAGEAGKRAYIGG